MAKRRRSAGRSARPYWALALIGLIIGAIGFGVMSLAPRLAREELEQCEAQSGGATTIICLNRRDAARDNTIIVGGIVVVLGALLLTFAFGGLSAARRSRRKTRTVPARPPSLPEIDYPPPDKPDELLGAVEAKLRRAAELHQQGLLDESEYKVLKERIINGLE